MWNRDNPGPKGLVGFVEENEWQGMRDSAAFLAVPAAIRFQAEHGWPRVRAECHELTALLD